MKVLLIIIVSIYLVGCIYCQSANDLVDDAAKKFNVDTDDFDSIKKSFEDRIPDFNELENFNKTRLPKVEDVENVLQEKCEKNGAVDALETLKDEQESLTTCVQSYINVTVVEEELEEAKKTGSMDEVFGKYCKKWPTVYKCFDNVTSIARSCLDENEKKAFNKSLEILSELQEFMCFKDGDRLAMFVAEGGIKCVEERKQGVQDCLNATLGGRIPDANDISVSTLPTFLFSTQDCQDFDTIRQCVNTELEKCSDSTPANIVDAFFKFMKKHMPCDSAVKLASVDNNDPGKSGCWSLTASALLLVASLISVKMY